MLRHLCAQHAVHLAYFEDDWADRLHRDVLRDMCASLCPVPVTRLSQRLLGARSFLTGNPITTDSYPSGHIRRYIRACRAKHGIDAVIAFSGAMTALVPDDLMTITLFDMVDADSEKWAAYADGGSVFSRYIFGREARLLRAFECDAIQRARVTSFISRAEANILQSAVPDRHLDVIPNGVDTAQFPPKSRADRASRPTVIFTGAMDYAPNVEAVEWFAAHCWHDILAAVPDAEFVIAGAPVARRVQALGRYPGIRITGRVPEMAPYLAAADVAVTPIVTARGVQNKVLEALACGTPVVSTVEAATGLPEASLGGDASSAPDGVITAVRGDDFTAAVTSCLRDRDAAFTLGQSGSAYIARDVSMAAMQRALDACLAKILQGSR